MKQFFKYVFASMIGFLLAQGFLIFSTLFLIGLAVGFSVVKNSPQKVVIQDDEDRILKINLSGQVFERGKIEEMILAEEFSLLEHAPITLYGFQKAIEKAETDEKVKGIYLKIGSLSAGWATLTSMREALEQFKKSGKFIYAYGDLYSEETYYLASIADSIFMYPEGSFELNGFATVIGFFKGLLEKLELKPEIFRAGSYKSAVEPFLREDMSEKNREQIQVFNNDLWKVFASSVSQSRKISIEEINRLSSGLLVTSAEDAKKYKLIDQVKYEDQVIEFLKGVVPPNKDGELPFTSLSRYLLSKNNKSMGSAKNFIKVSFSEKMKKKEGQQIAVVFAEGEIHLGKSQDESIGAETFVELLRKLRKDEDVKAIVLRVNSPGGAALAADEIWREVSLTDKVKPVIASFGDIAASGGYYIGAGARKILAQPTTLTGSIGVFGLSFVTKDMFKNKLGITFDRVVTHNSADMGLGHRSMTEAETFVIEKEIDRVYGRFLSIVEKGRKMSEEQARELAGGRIWSGTAALKNRLVDQLGDLPDAIELAASEAKLNKDQYRLEIYPQEEVPFGRFLQFVARRAEVLLGVSWPMNLLRGVPQDILKSSNSSTVDVFARTPWELTVH